MLPTDFKSFEELMQGIEELPAPKTFGEAAFEDQEAVEGLPASISIDAEWPPIVPDREPAAPISEAAFSERKRRWPTGNEELPQVITADMLRARMAKRKEASFSEQNIEIPAELLAGLDAEELQEDEEWIDEAMGAHAAASARRKPRARPRPSPAAKSSKTETKKKAPKKRGWGDEEDFLDGNHCGDAGVVIRRSEFRTRTPALSGDTLLYDETGTRATNQACAATHMHCLPQGRRQARVSCALFAPSEGNRHNRSHGQTGRKRERICTQCAPVGKWG
jgi:hypothetical protein